MLCGLPPIKEIGGFGAEAFSMEWNGAAEAEWKEQGTFPALERDLMPCAVS